MLWPARTIGAATAAYSIAVIVKPDGSVDRGTATLIRGTCARDLVSGLAMAALPRARGVRLAGLIRIGADLADAAGMGLALPDATARKKAAAVAGGWAALTAAALWAARGEV